MEIDALELMNEHNISLFVDPDWNPSLGPEKWLAIRNMKFDAGFSGSEWTGWIDGDGYTGDSVARGTTAREAFENLCDLDWPSA